jgi:hypothetical protein
MKPPVQPFSFAAGLHGRPEMQAAVIATLGEHTAQPGWPQSCTKAPILHENDKKSRGASMGC